MVKKTKASVEKKVGKFGVNTKKTSFFWDTLLLNMINLKSSLYLSRQQWTVKNRALELTMECAQSENEHMKSDLHTTR